MYIPNVINPQITNQDSKFESIIGIGNPMIDFSTHLEKDDIKNFNLSFGETVFCDEQNKSLIDNIDKCSILNKIPGGSIMNTLRVCSWCLNKNQNTNNNYIITMLGAIGDDDLKEKIINSLEKTKVVPLLQIIPREKSSTCGIIVNNKEKCLVPDIQASKNLTMEFITQNINIIFNHDILLIESYYLKENYKICKYLCEEFKRQNKLVILTVNAIIVKNYLKEVIEIANMCDIIYGNFLSIKLLANSIDSPLKQIFEKVHQILSPKNRLLLVNGGNNHGVYCSKYDYQNNKLDLNMQCFPINIKNEEIKDFIGDGPAFLGGFLSMFLKGNTSIQQLGSCCKIGHTAANEILKNTGCTFPEKCNIKC